MEEQTEPSIEHEWTYPAEKVRVLDGITFDLKVDLGFYSWKEVRVRLLDINMSKFYDVSDKNKRYARKKDVERFVKLWFGEAESLVVETVKAHGGKDAGYGCRLVNESGELLSDALIEEYELVERRE